MTDDIVTRLRDRLEESFCHCVEDPFFVCSYCAIEEAADEIERLRKDRDRWREMAVDLYNACTYLDIDDRVEALAYIQNALIQERLDKAVRGE